MPENDEHRALARRPPWGLAIGVAVFLGIVTVAAWPLIPTLADPEATRTLVADAGPWGPVVFIALHALQVVVAPIPGQAAVVAGGYLFGPYLGLAYSLAGATLGTVVVVALGRWLGRPFVERFVPERHLRRFDAQAERRGPAIFFLFFLLPALPDDIVAFAAGLTGIPLGTLMAISVAGRLPGFLVLSLAGQGLTGDSLTPVVVAAGALAVLVAVAAWKRARLLEFVDSDDRLGLLKSQFRPTASGILLWVLVGGALIALLGAVTVMAVGSR